MLGEQEVDTEKEELDKEKEVADKKGGEMEENRVMVEKRQVKFYAAQLVSQQEAVRDRSVFMDTLRQFHAAMGTKFMYA
ncbi:putative high mobility group B protein 9 [Cocos nucifera]|uniref:Putative high mobility group B protein 9 n=1 Tax=Cocos nucifera TaxID=13894 RepID=A0A8K0N5H6_COCNU|nr:putative high mobility group B protein 9 [Cocos nucifera]